MLHLETTKDFEFYPEAYLQDVAKRLECPIEKLSIIYEIGDIDEISSFEDIQNELNEFETEQLEVLEDNYTDLCIGSIEFFKLKFKDGFELKVIAEQNASPVGIWISDDEIENLQRQQRN